MAQNVAKWVSSDKNDLNRSWCHSEKAQDWGQYEDMQRRNICIGKVKDPEDQ